MWFLYLLTNLSYGLYARFSLTLIDTLDTLVVSRIFFLLLQFFKTKCVVNCSTYVYIFFFLKLLNKTTEFEDAVRRVLSDVRLDNDIVVSVFETNIRVLG